MTFQTLALISLVALLGPLLALPRAWRLPVVVGELVAGLALGPSGIHLLHTSDTTFTFLANLGFALVMFVAGSHVPIRDPKLKTALRIGSVRALAVGACSVAIALLVAHLFGTGHVALYAVLMASSSAALVLPIIDSLKLTGEPVLQLIPQVALADTVCIIALPLAIDSKHVGRAALGATAVLACALVLFFLLRYLERSGLRLRLHRASEDRQLALELRISLIILCGLAAVATQTHVSIMLAGFSFGLAVAAVGEPRRLARQLFALTEGFLGPLFFVWVGASLDLRQLGHHPKFVLLGLALAAGALVSHMAMRATGQPLAVGALAAAQLGVPVAAVTVGSQLHVLKAGEPAALILAALLSIGIASVAARHA
jgi:Kef-type K+ transport system membrane component KefB